MKPQYSPYLEFSRQQWREFRNDTPLPLTEAEIVQLRGQNEPVSIEEVTDIYLPLSRLLNLYVAATQELYRVTSRFLGHAAPKVPYIIGIAGSVAVGKSTTSRILQALLARWPDHPRVALITTDGYLFPNVTLEERGLINRKGFPESYDLRRLIEFLSALKAGQPQLKVPVYSHHYYDIMPNEFQLVDQPDIVIVEGLNVLQVGQQRQQSRVFVSDFFDFTIYVDAPTPVIKQWYIERFMQFRRKAIEDPAAFFNRFLSMTDEAAMKFAAQVWQQINEANLHENILPFRDRAKLILVKDADHSVKRVLLRKI